MGYGNYSYEAHESLVSSRTHQSRDEVFKQSNVHPLMNPFGVGMRESRDSPDHPNSLPIIFALDVTGSMGAIPDMLARRELPHFMKTLLTSGVTDPQVLFMFMGDAAHDAGPLQVGQFESTAEDMDRWLTWSWLEGGGGGNGSESYDLAMYFAARHTDTDAASKRQKRGYFFMTGDENPYPSTARNWVRSLIGDDLPKDVPLQQVCTELAAVYHPFFLIPDPSRLKRCESAWRKVLGDHVICLQESEDTCRVAAALVALCEGAAHNVDAIAKGLEVEKLDRKRIAGIVRALTPFAATLERDFPRLQPVFFP
ncbi:VWA domain-containing protein [bacterium]|nr:VWA domain-containing protein [bacterium]